MTQALWKTGRERHCGYAGWPDSTSSRRRLRALLSDGMIDTSHFTGQGWLRGVKLPRRVPVDAYLRIGGPGIRGSALRQRLIEDGIFDAVCMLCGQDTWQGRPIPLELDHVNGDRTDNRLENLRVICPNCHAFTPTYRGRNIGRYNKEPA